VIYCLKDFSPRVAPRSSCRQNWPAKDSEQIQLIAQTGGGLVDLWETSPIRLESGRAATEEIIDAMFPCNSLLCCGWERWRFDTRPRRQWRGKLSQMQFIVPSPMRAREGRTLTQRLSAHSLDNTGSRRFLVIEFDFDREPASKDEPPVAAHSKHGFTVEDLCAALLLHLAKIAPLALVAHSGNRSLQGWFFCAGQSEEILRSFMSHAVSIGADPMTWLRSQFVRMPDGLRDTGSRQRIFFFNPKVIQ
jgi:hypothetical protein